MYVHPKKRRNNYTYSIPNFFSALQKYVNGDQVDSDVDTTDNDESDTNVS
jgi:hypothetical protein